MDHYVITITRQFGSLGRPIAKKLSELLKIDYYDRDIVEETSKNLGLPVSVISNEEEVVKSSFFNMSYPLGNDTTDMQDAIFSEQLKIICMLVEKKSAIVVGRCSDYVLRNNKNTVNVFIYAPYEARLRNCVDYLHLDLEIAKKMITKVDKSRDKYHKKYAGFLPGDYNFKDIEIDSSMLGVEGTAKVLANIIKQKFCLEE